MRIYIIWRKKTGVCYVGQTTRPINLRMNAHRAGKGSEKMAIGRAIKKYGWGEFDYSVIQECSTQEELNDAERFWIDKYDSLVPNGYNIRGGGANWRHSEETKEKMRGPRVSYNLSEDGRRRGVESHALCLSRSRSAESNEKRSKAMKGVPKTTETRLKMAKSAHNKILTEEKVARIKRLLYSGRSLNSVAKEFDVSKSAIAMISGGRSWKHVEMAVEILPVGNQSGVT